MHDWRLNINLVRFISNNEKTPPSRETGTLFLILTLTCYMTVGIVLPPLSASAFLPVFVLFIYLSCALGQKLNITSNSTFLEYEC